MTARELTESSKWWNGPDFLQYPEAEWPDCKFDKWSREAMTELKSTPRRNNESLTNYNVVQLLTNERDVQTDKLKKVEWR